MRLLIITGLSGSGKSTAARALEDDGYFVVDNLPPALLAPFLALHADHHESSDLAVVIDARNRMFLGALDNSLRRLTTAGVTIEILFFEASDETLQRRYSETRRSHPLSPSGSVADGIAEERRILSPLRDRATRLIDSTGLTPHQLRAQVVRMLRGHQEDDAPLTVIIESFGYRYGLPAGADLVFDVRFLPNPHFIDALRPHTGLDAEVSAYVLDKPLTRVFLEKLEGLLDFLLPEYRREGKSYLTIAVGCTGGRHRSVALAEYLAQRLAVPGQNVRVTHRDMDKS